MNRISRAFACGVLIALAAAFASCGGKQSMASKSAAAYADAKKKGIPVTAGEHGGHVVEEAAPPATDHAGMEGMQHATMSGMNHMKMPAGHAGMAGMDHGAMQMAEHAGMSGMDHSK